MPVNKDLILEDLPVETGETAILMTTTNVVNGTTTDPILPDQLKKR